ncbi:MAG: acetyl-CoA carboxylase biotin carboxylase subunit [Chloroflexota bacterium]|nr:acetyl-CoA carboxylase biotin carboxylase subunit [Chloroflexota bacterium]
MFEKVLIANRGEIAVRIIRTLREMGIRSVAAYSDADREALFVQEADEAFRLGPAAAGESYLNVEAIMSVALQSGAQAIHPGYGFLAENAGFAEVAEEAGLVFIGPSPRAIRLMGDKVEARRLAQALHVPVVPGTPGPVESVEEALVFANAAGYPIAVKAAAGGGGRGIRVARTPEELPASLEAARREAQAYFHNPQVYLERYYENPRHIEIQVLGDRLGNLVHLGERDCSVQRRHQKLIEETPSPAVNRELRRQMGETALRLARAVEYSSAGTVEFLLARDGEFFFLEMNTRIQVEHPITERVTGVDLIREMVLAAAGEPITLRESVLDLNGHAIEVRVNAENPAESFRPTPALITHYQEPGGIGVRMDSGVYAGYTIPDAYDSLMAKLISWAPDREAARRRALRALGEFRIAGPSSTIPFALAVLESEPFVAGTIGTTFVGEHLDQLVAAMPEQSLVGTRPGESIERTAARSFEVEVNRKLFRVRVAEIESEAGARSPKRQKSLVVPSVRDNEVTSPMHGTIIAVRTRAGEQVEVGQTLFVIEAMKMENEVSARRAGTIESVVAEFGQTVEAGQRLATIE